MTTYIAPVRDMMFVLNELADLQEVGALPGCEEVNPELVESILDEAGKFASEIIAPLNASGDRQGSRLEKDGAVKSPEGFKQAYRKFVENGWGALSCPPEFGGQGLPQIVAKPVQEMWKAANLSFSLCPMLTQGAIEALVHHASPQLRETFLPKMVSGEWRGTMNLTEPQAGSDLAAVRSRAEPEGDHYRIYGMKIFITWGEQDLTGNIVHLVLARLPDAPEGVKGISLFVVPKFLVNPDGSLGRRNDLQCVSLEHKMGIHASPTAVMAYGDKEGAIGYLVGQPNRGLEYMFTMMNHARLAVGLEGLAISDRAYQQALNYAKERVQGRALTQPGAGRVTIIHHPDVRRMLMSMKSQVEAMRAVAYLTAGYMDQAARHPDKTERARYQGLVDFMTPVVKGWCTENSIEITSTGIQVHGGMGFIEETGACQHMRDARITTIYEGTTGIQANDLIGRKMARENGTTLKVLLEIMRADQAKVARVSDPDFNAIAASQNAGLDAVAECAEWVVKTYHQDPAQAAAVAVPFLMLIGTVCGGWQMGRAALVARERLAAQEGDESFHKAKIKTSRFYADHILPRAVAYRHAVVQGAEDALALEENQF
ncbi:MAG: acyl-CoA dehydrogenase [Betaproteobacteria bacterium]|nr:acyl-CoA dehydrogenase [Betaproteobacteria bacterium]